MKISVKLKNKLVEVGLDEDQIEELLNEDQMSEEIINDICIFLEKTNYKFIKEHNEKVLTNRKR